MNVKDTASQISVIFGIQHDWRDQISGVHVSPGIAETLARGGGITYHYLITYSLSNISAKKLPKSVNVRWSYSVLHQCRFFEIQCKFWRHRQNQLATEPATLVKPYHSKHQVLSVALPCWCNACTAQSICIQHGVMSLVRYLDEF